MKLQFVFALCLAMSGCSQSPNRGDMSATRLKIASGVLFSVRAFPDKYGNAFYFDDEVRPSRLNRNNPGDLTFDPMTGKLSCRKDTEDFSTILDLGEKSWNRIDGLPAQRPSETHAVPAVAGHAYLVRINDGKADFWAIVRVVRIVPNERCDIEWVRIDTSEHLAKPTISLSTQERLAGLLNGQDANIDPSFMLRSPKVLLQIRAGAGGGNPNRIDMLGRSTAYVDQISSTPLTFDAAPTMQERSVAYVSGGHVPAGKCFVIKKITFRGSANGDSNGHGEFIVHAGHTEIAKERGVPVIPGGKWEGHIEIRPGEEGLVYVEVANSSMANVVIEGELIIDKVPARPDSGLDTALLEQEPRIILQLRNGADGGNPNRIDMLGHKSIYIQHISTTPLSFVSAPMMSEPGIAYFKGCRIPAGKMLVIKAIRYSGSAMGDSNGDGAIILHVGKDSIVNLRNVTVVPETKWEGKIEIRRGEEDGVYLEVANSSMANALIEGEFADDHRRPSK